MGLTHSRHPKPNKPTDIPPQSFSHIQLQFLENLFKAEFKGKILQKGSGDYTGEITPWNLRCAPKPLAIVYPLNADEVATVVRIATKHGIPVQPRSGGHSFASYSLGGKDDALVVDLSKMNTVVVDQTTWRATIGGGTRLKKVTDELYNQGQRTMAHGICPQVGIGGHATVGGQGPLSRMYGLTLDHVVEMEVVLADGSITRVNEEINSDLFFALRGAGASFGIVTQFIFETHPVPEATTNYTFQLKYGTHEELATIFLQWQDFISSPAVSNDRAFNSLITITSNIILIQGSRLGSRDDFETSEIFVSMKKMFTVDIKTHELDWLGSIVNWATIAVESLAGSMNIPLYMKSLSVRQNKLLTPETVHAWFDYMHNNSPKDAVWVIIGDMQGGRISDFPNDSTAYSLRDCMYTLCAYSIGGVPYPDDALAYMNGMIHTISTNMPDGNFGVYPGYVDPLIPNTQWPTQYWGENYPRLLAIKKKYDPTNTFSNPQSVGADRRPPAKPAFQMKGSQPVLNV
ncbi:hypothetical protein Clacol_004503 [Clathrus columnatus]|uniref:FAD-binding PCMH-type domain-containing protein n=1 Tax=Clathrus columnatus TaxID=1419009 RepID=A0AAV5A6P0_9AGAM|nr:hypothetical protein Clacol_004503 [Clathrus columnatus]